MKKKQKILTQRRKGAEVDKEHGIVTGRVTPCAPSRTVEIPHQLAAGKGLPHYQRIASSCFDYGI